MTNTTDSGDLRVAVDEALDAFYDKEFGDLPVSTWRPIWDAFVRATGSAFDDAREQHDAAVRVYSDELVLAADKGVNAERYRRHARAKWETAGERIEYAKRNRIRVAQEKMNRALAAVRQEAGR